MVTRILPTKENGYERFVHRSGFYGSRTRDFSPIRDSVHALDSRDLAQIGHQVLPETDIDSRRVLFRDGTTAFTSR